jgi:hypothetical protein
MTDTYFNDTGGMNMRKSLLFVLLLILGAGFAYADGSFTVNGLDFGSSDQDRAQTVISNLNIMNNGNQTLTIHLTSTLPTAYQVSFSQNDISIASGNSIEVPVSIYIPEDQDSGKKSIGTIVATATNVQGLSRISTVTLTAVSKLIITKVKLDVDGDSSTVKDGDTVDAKPGDDIQMTVTVKNEFNENVDINDITVNVDSNDLDINDDQQDLSDLNDGDKDTADFTLHVDPDLDEDTYDIDVDVEGKDDNGARHTDKLTFGVKVKKKSHEITVQSSAVNPESISCGGRVTVNTEIENSGNRNEDKVTLAFKSTELSLYQRWQDIQLDEGDSYKKSYSFAVPSSLAPGEYFINVLTYYDTDVESNSDIVSLTVAPCGNTQTTNTTNNNMGNNANGGSNTGTTGNVVTVPVGAVGPVYGGSTFFDTSAYMILLVAAVIIVGVLIVLMIVKLAKK